MKDRDTNDLTIQEFLPRNSTPVDLLHPELMTSSEILMLFQRRGLGNLVSKSDPLHRLVDLYYDHLMPMPMRTNSPEPTAVSLPQADKVIVSKPHTVTAKVPMKRKVEEVNLDSLVINHNPNWTTPGDSVKNAERVLSVKKPKSSDSLVQNHTNPFKESIPAKLGRPVTLRTTTVTVTTNGSENIPINPTPVVDSFRKRAKLKRDFTGIS